MKKNSQEDHELEQPLLNVVDETHNQSASENERSADNNKLTNNKLLDYSSENSSTLHHKSNNKDKNEKKTATQLRKQAKEGCEVDVGINIRNDEHGSHQTLPFIKIKSFHFAQSFTFWWANFLCKAPLIVFEGYEYYCNYDYDNKIDFSKKNISALSTLIIVFLILLYKHYYEHSRIKKNIKEYTSTINLLHLAMCRQLSPGMIAWIEGKLHDEAKKLQLENHPFVLNFKSVPHPLTLPLTMPLSLSSKKTPFSCLHCFFATHYTLFRKLSHANSEQMLDMIDSFELWIGIAWLAYCFCNDFHEKKMSSAYIIAIISCGIVYMFLQVTLSKVNCIQDHAHVAQVFSQHVRALFEAHTLTYRHPQRPIRSSQRDKWRRDSMPQILRQQQKVDDTSRRRHSWS